MSADNEGPDKAQRADDLAWKEIVANFGDRVELEPEAEPVAVAPVPAPVPPASHVDPAEDEGHYVPPPPPAIPTPEPRRALAWAGLFGAPVIALIALVAKYDMPGWADGFLFLAFIGGFGYLVATMSRGDDRDGWDDGAVV